MEVSVEIDREALDLFFPERNDGVEQVAAARWYRVAPPGCSPEVATLRSMLNGYASAQAIACNTGLSTERVEQAIDRLMSIGMVEVDAEDP